MTVTYLEGTLRALNKTQLIELKNTLTEEMKNFKKLESDVAVVKNVNNILCKSVERQCWKNAKYTRRESVEVVGIPSSITDD